jgi:hypothetical protein
MNSNTLNRYTTLASLISILKNKEITLLDPSKWEDKNDSHYLLQYRKRKGLKSIYALCFTTESETAHHWKVFANGSDGICIKIVTDEFIANLDKIAGVVHGKVEYKLINEVEKEIVAVDQLPFLKRHPFRDEDEYRVIFGTTVANESKTVSIPFDTSSIREIKLSNSLPVGLVEPLVALLKSIDGCTNMKITRSTLNENVRWKKACKRAT